MRGSTQSVAIVTGASQGIGRATGSPVVDRLSVAHGWPRGQIAVISSILRDVLLHLRGNARRVGSFQGI
jgi:hypothetical protein